MSMAMEAFDLSGGGTWDDQRDDDLGDQVGRWQTEGTPTSFTVVHAPPDFDFQPTETSDPMERMIARWVYFANRHARVRRIGNVWVADVVHCPGAWAEGRTAKAALADLPSVLDDWVRMKLDDGDRDIPAMEGLKLVIEA